MRSVGLLTVSLLLCACGGASDGSDSAVVASAGTPGVQQHTIVVDKPVGGTIASGPAALDCGSKCAASFDAQSEVMLIATAAPGYIFEGWTGPACTTSLTRCGVNMVADVRVGASFKAVGDSGY
jgi:uncharacterized repeat protein (TIGR02543 family)